MVRGSSSFSMGSWRNLRIRRETDLSSLFSCLSAVGEISTFHAIAPHYFFKRDGLAPPRANIFQCLLRQVDVFQIIQILEDSFTRIIGFSPARPLGEGVEA